MTNKPRPFPIRKHKTVLSPESEAQSKRSRVLTTYFRRELGEEDSVVAILSVSTLFGEVILGLARTPAEGVQHIDELIGILRANASEIWATLHQENDKAES